jgi:hypothetical protein
VLSRDRTGRNLGKSTSHFNTRACKAERHTSLCSLSPSDGERAGGGVWVVGEAKACAFHVSKSLSQRTITGTSQ